MSCNQTLVNAALYTAVFGLSPQRLPADSIEYGTFHDGEPAALSYWMPCFTVDSLDATTRALKKHDETVVNGRLPAPTAASWSPKTRGARLSRT